MLTMINNVPQSVLLLLSAVGILLGIISLIYAIAVHLYAGKIKKRYLSLVRGESGIDMESLIQTININIDQIKNQILMHDERLENHELRLRKKSSQPIVKRYNAFGESGNDLSFSISILNEEGNGVVLSSIYGREDSIVFAKPIIERQSSYKLTTEENEVINSSK